MDKHEWDRCSISAGLHFSNWAFGMYPPYDRQVLQTNPTAARRTAKLSYFRQYLVCQSIFYFERRPIQR